MTEKRYRPSYGDGQVIIDSFEKNSFSPYYEGLSRIINRLNEQHETIQALTNDKKELQEYMARRDNKVQETLQKQLNKYTERAILLKEPYGDVTKAILDIAEELGVELK